MAPIIIKVKGYRHRSKIAAFDFDWTLVKPKEGRRFPKNVEDWQWLYPHIPNVLCDWYSKGWGIVIFTNQTKPWKLDQIKAALSNIDIPLLIVVAMDKTEHKPSRIMWDTVIGEKKVTVSSSFFVGDALGRPGDWSDTDKLFAETIGVSYEGPEEAFPVLL